MWPNYVVLVNLPEAKSFMQETTDPTRLLNRFHFRIIGASQVITSLVSFPMRNLFFHTCSLVEVDQAQQILKMMFNQKIVVLQAS